MGANAYGAGTKVIRRSCTYSTYAPGQGKGISRMQHLKQV